MIIRSQDKKTIVDFGAGCALEAMQGDDWIGVAFVNNNDESIDLGYYDSMDEAIAAIDYIFCVTDMTSSLDMPERGKMRKYKN